MDSFWIILAFVLGAIVAKWSSATPPTETPVQTLKRAYTAIVEPKQAVDVNEPDKETDIDKVIHEITPPNLFERRQAIENEERRLEDLRKRALEEL